jgi:tetratricopeptide (TPR) repeat protein
VPDRALAALLALAVPLSACVIGQPHPRSVEQVHRGYRHLAAGDRERAEVAFEHALEIAPDLAEARNGLGVALRAAGRPVEALAQFDLALSADPDLAEAHVNRGEALAALGLEAEADAAFGDALRLDPDQVPARIDRARLLARRALGAHGDERRLLLDRARRDLLHALEARPDMPQVHQVLGWVSWQRGDVAFASACYDEAVRLDPGLVEARAGACGVRARDAPCEVVAASCRACIAAAPPASREALHCGAMLAARPECEPKTKGAPARADAPR